MEEIINYLKKSEKLYKKENIIEYYIVYLWIMFM